MNIQTKFLGEVSIDEQTIINFPNGIPGFETYTKFVLLPFKENTPFLTLQSTETLEVGFMVGVPYAFHEKYDFDLSEEDVAALQLEKPEDVAVYGIITLKQSLSTSTINLLAPVVINTKQQVGIQVVLTKMDDKHLRFPLKALEGSAR